VGVVTTGFAVRPRSLKAGVARLRAMGLTVILGEHVLSQDGYLAGSDELRLADLNRLLRDSSVQAIWFARGGYGTSRLLDRVDWVALSTHPKLLIGYSDLTALFAPAIERTGRVCVYGPVVSELGDPGAYHAPSLGRLLRGQPVDLPVPRRQVLRAGRARGRLLGGNLTLLVHLLGTRHAPDLRGAILLLEDVGEEVYRLDRMFVQLRMSGALREVRAVALGSFDAPPTERDFPPDRDLEEVVRESFVPLGIPVVTGLPVGHVPRKRPLPLGGLAELDTTAGLLRVWPSARRP
jgi:muramoyltetrapeptide carboxypeptidase